MDWVGTAFALHVSQDLVCVRVTSKTTVSSAPALGPTKTSDSLPDLIRSGCWPHSRVPRELSEHRRAYAVVSTRSLLHRCCIDLATPRGCHSSSTMSSNVRQRCDAWNRRFHVCSPTANEASAAPARRYMVHAWLGEYDTLRLCAVSADDV